MITFTCNVSQWRGSASRRNCETFEGWPSCLVFVGWSLERRKLGIRHCYNRPCALCAARAPLFGSDAICEQKEISVLDSSGINVTQGLGSVFFPLFCPDGRSLVFLSARSCVDSGAHWGTESLHRIDWIADLKIPVVQCSEDGGFPGLYSAGFLRNPWLSDGSTIVLNSVWHSSEVLLAVNVVSGVLRRISPSESNSGWHALSLDDDNIIAVSSSPVDLPEIKYGHLANKEVQTSALNWLSVPSPMINCSDRIGAILKPMEVRGRISLQRQLQLLTLQSSRVKTPTLFLIGANDLPVPPSNGIQYARALKEKGVETKMIIFPNDVHGIDRPESDYESFLNIGVWFKKYCN